MTSIPTDTRAHIRKAHRDLMLARQHADAVERPDGTDSTGHPGIQAANLEGYLGRFTLPLLDALERAEGELWKAGERERRADHLRLRVILFVVFLIPCALMPDPFGLLAASIFYLVVVMRAI